MLLESFDLPAYTTGRARTDRRKRGWWLSGAGPPRSSRTYRLSGLPDAGNRARLRRRARGATGVGVERGGLRVRRGERRGRQDGPGVGSAALPIVGDSVAVAGRWQSGGAGGQALRGHHGAVRAVAATGRRVVSVAADRTLRFWCRCRARAAGQLLSPRAGAGPGGERWRAAWRCGPHCGAVCARGLRRRGGADLGLA